MNFRGSRLFVAKKYAAVVIVAVAFSLVIVTSRNFDSVPFCVQSAGCRGNETLRGRVTVKSYGFPATYKQVSIFNPANTNENSGGYAGYAQAQVTTKEFSILSVVADIVFWTALLLIPARFVKQRSPKPASASEPVAPIH